MFEQSLVESTPLLRSRNRWPAIASIATQAIVVAIILAIPLLHPELLPTGDLKLSALTPPVLRHPVPPPQTQPVHVAIAPSATSPSAPSQQPAILHRPAPGTDATPVDAPALAFGDPNGRPTANLLATLGNAPTAPTVTGSGGTHTTGPLRISSLSAGMLLAPIRPIYPQIARITHTEGTVIVQATISRTGQIESARILSGPPMLQNAALDAVRSAHYHPYLLNGQPTEVETTITIHFTLGS
jgi:protein TonB